MPPPLDPNYTSPQRRVEMVSPEEIGRILQRVQGMRTPRDEYTSSSGPYYAPELYIQEEGGPKKPQDAYTEPGVPTWGSSATPHSAAFDAFHQSSAYSMSTTPPSNHGIEPMHHQRPMIPQFGLGSLPCEFKNLSGCDMVFQFLEVNQWIEHMINEHLVACFPTYSICWFCDAATFDGSSRGAAGRSQLYRQRMHHIATHFYAGEIAAEIRPDFFFLDHLHENNLIDEETFQRAKQQGELPDMYMPHAWYEAAPRPHEGRPQRYAESRRRSSHKSSSAQHHGRHHHRH
ncbi:hypothetical protein QQS21_008330 [Conoideocrella luteorostrata]|uniref:Uncharacterized protein n=1 Tax=Conoideocrella luteorostrata TaxID=1105319 RepID=A0AAJ0CJ35_9HYPO|nr:hypothetical protein QQS21_008330 [Conoideocrella luteorostrata]